MLAPLSDGRRTKLRKDSFSFESDLPARVLSTLQYSNIRALTLLSTFRDERLLLDEKQLLLFVRVVIALLPLLGKLTLEIPLAICNWKAYAPTANESWILSTF
jgi:hypothetical protein